MMMRRSQEHGFTMLDLMVSVAILAVLAAIAIPQYRQYTVRGNRAAVQGQMMQIASLMERYRAVTLQYKKNTTGNLFPDTEIYNYTVYPSTKSFYNVDMQSHDGLTWTLTATPISTSIQKGDGAMSINQSGARCWNPSGDTSCSFSTDKDWSVKSK